MKRPSALWVVLLMACMSLVATLYVAFAQGNQAKKTGTGTWDYVARAHDQQATKHVSLIGTMTCTACRFTRGERFVCPDGCCENCIKHGDPVLFTDRAGNQYVLGLKAHNATLMNADRYKLLGQNVRVTGLLAQGKGVRFILLDTVTKAPKP
jgi:hypothetical protein